MLWLGPFHQENQGGSKLTCLEKNFLALFCFFPGTFFHFLVTFLVVSYFFYITYTSQPQYFSSTLIVCLNYYLDIFLVFFLYSQGIFTGNFFFTFECLSQSHVACTFTCTHTSGSGGIMNAIVGWREQERWNQLKNNERTSKSAKLPTF